MDARNAPIFLAGMAVCALASACERDVGEVPPIEPAHGEHTTATVPGGGPVATPVDAVALGALHSCAVLPNSTLKCWGENSAGQLGYGDTENTGDDEPASDRGTVDVGAAVDQVAAGDAHTCVLMAGAIRCFGSGRSGRLGYGNTANIGDNEAPSSQSPVNVGGTASQVKAGRNHSCALLDSGGVVCFGENAIGELGYGHRNPIGDNEAPADAGTVSLGANAMQIDSYGLHNCAILEGGDLRCWGRNKYGQLGIAGTADIGDNEVPSDVAALSFGAPVDQVAVGKAHTCALVAGNVYCWGDGRDGRLGYGNTNQLGDTELATSIPAVSVGGTVTAIAVGGFHTCALLEGGSLRCWGRGNTGQLGQGNGDNIGDNELPSEAAPISVGGTVVQVSAGDTHTCAVLDTQELRCWGNGFRGRLGHGDTEHLGDNELPSATPAVPL